MKSISIAGSSVDEIQATLARHMADGYKPTLAIIFISIKKDRQAVCQLFSDQGIDVIGATSSGEFINGHHSEGEIVVMLFDIRRENYTILYEDIGERSLQEAAVNQAQTALDKFDTPAFILLSTSLSESGDFLKGELLLRSIEHVLGPQVNIFGGMAGDDMTLTGTYVFTNGLSTDNGFVSLVFNEDKVNLHGMAISGWNPIGVFRTVTKSEGNLIYSIDGKPAMEMYLRYLGVEKSTTDDQLNFFESVGVHYPFQIEREDRGPMMCAPMGYDKEKEALICESDVAEGSKFRFSTPPDFDIVETISQKAREVKQHAHAKAEALLIFSCAGRLNALGPMAHQENEGLAEVWNTPMAGFYSYGEYGRDENGKHEFHSTTCCWTAISEK